MAMVTFNDLFCFVNINNQADKDFIENNGSDTLFSLYIRDTKKPNQMLFVQDKWKVFF